jgi:predicted amidohydrolase
MKLIFTGKSQIIGPRGEVLARSDEVGEKLVLFELDHAAARNKTITPRNDLLGDRRPDSYCC